jgi:hypothetical protein
MHARPTWRTCSVGLMALSLLASCAATTSLTLAPSPQTALCQRSPQRINAVVLWGTNWRVEQKDVTDRETAANNGIARFFQESGCFANVEIRRLSSSATPHEHAAAMANQATTDVALVVIVRELGPVLKLGSSAALIEGGTEVVLDFVAYQARAATPPRAFSAHWQNGGPGVVKGVASLPADIESALAASLQPEPK